MRGRNYTKPFSIVGIVLGEIYMLYTVLAPYHKGPHVPLKLPISLPAAPLGEVTVPLSHMILKISVCSVAFGLFGALVGLGFGLLATGMLSKPTPPTR